MKPGTFRLPCTMKTASLIVFIIFSHVVIALTCQSIQIDKSKAFATNHNSIKRSDCFDLSIYSN